jgi:hypothetical protein
MRAAEVAEVFGLQIGDLPEDWQPVEVLVVVKCLRPEGDAFPYGLAARASQSLSNWEGEGMANWAARAMVRDIDQEEG